MKEDHSGKGMQDALALYPGLSASTLLVARNHNYTLINTLNKSLTIWLLHLGKIIGVSVSSHSPQVFLSWIKALSGFAAGTFNTFLSFQHLFFSFTSVPKMKHIAAYLLLTLGGKENPSAADIKALLDTVGIEADSERLEKLISELEGKDINTLIAEGQSKLASVPSGGAAPAAGASAGAAAAAGGAAPAAEEKKEEEKEESDDDMGFGLFD